MAHDGHLLVSSITEPQVYFAHFFLFIFFLPVSFSLLPQTSHTNLPNSIYAVILMYVESCTEI